MSCGDDSGGGGCEAGEIKGCTCVGGDVGEQICNDEGTAFGACDCDGTGGGNGGNGGSAGGASMAGSSGMGGPVMPVVDIGLIGAPCNSDADCSDAVDGFTCIESSSNAEFQGGGPEGGYCTVACRDTSECTALDGASACGLRDGNGDGYCLALCIAGTSNAKCGAGEYRAQACVENPNNQPGSAPLGACFPICTSDEGCGEGRFCSQNGDTIGLCVDTPTPGGALGAACTPETEATDCASGICLTFSNGGVVAGGFCTTNCTYGSLFGCGYPLGAPATTPRPGACLQEQFPNGDFGDLGFCFELCDTDADCVQDDWECNAFGAGLQMQLGRVGQCVPPGVGNGGGAGDAGPG